MSNEELLKKLKKSQSDIAIICKHYAVFRKKFNRATQMVECMAARGRTLLDIKENINSVVKEIKNREGEL